MSATTVEADDGLPLTVPLLLHERAARRGDHPWLLCDEQVLSYADAEARSAALAKGLLASGAGRGSHVGLLHPNGPGFVVGWLAAARIGAVAVPLSTFSTAAELLMLLRGADIGVLLAAATFRNRDYVDALRDAVPSLDHSASPPLRTPAAPALRSVAFDGEGADAVGEWSMDTLLAGGADVDDEVLAAAETAVTPSDRMVIVHTSGSTRRPKGVIHQHGPLIRHLDNLNEMRRFAEQEILFSNSPFFWIGGFAYGLLGTLLAGATLVCSNATEPAATLDLLEQVQPTMVNGFAATVVDLANDPSFASRDLGSIRRGNLWPIMPDAVRALDPELRHNMLGMTEAGSVCLASSDEDDQPEPRRGSFGRPVPGFEAKVVDPDSGAECEAGAVGELWFRGPFLMEGYYGRERYETFTPDGWYRTGDLFHVDADGFFYFTGRSGDMIKTAGANVSPREVEAAIADATGLVAHVVGVDDPDRGELVAAAIRVPRDQDPPDPAALRALLRDRLSAYKVPRRFLMLADADVPMLSSGKLDARRAEKAVLVIPAPVTFPAVLRRNAAVHGAKPALITDERSITHGELDRDSRALAASLAALGVGKGARVGLVLPNGIDWAVIAAAASRIGGVLVPLSTLLRPPELEAQLQKAAVTHLVLAPAFRGRSYLDDLEQVAPGIRNTTRRGRRDARLPALRQVHLADELPEGATDDAFVEALEGAVRPADDFCVLFTSGSRGAPKGVIHTHGSALRAVASSLDDRCVGADDRLYIPMPFFWTGGLAGGLLSALVAGATLLTEAIPAPERTLDLLERERATLFRGWPDQAARLAAHPGFSTVDLSLLGPGSLPGVLPPDRRPAPGAQANLFGMTETFGPYCGARADVDLPEGKRGSCGRPFDGIEVKITDRATGAPAPAGGIGEICVRGPNLMRGICGRTDDSIFGSDGFYATGDLGALDRDGYLWFHGRRDDMFKVRGATVYPAEVEAAIRAIDGVRQVCVTNVREDGADAVGALVVTAVPLDVLVTRARSKLSAFKVPTRWVVTESSEDVPMTSTAKVDKAALQELLQVHGVAAESASHERTREGSGA